jgi:hypothetical protein
MRQESPTASQTCVATAQLNVSFVDDPDGPAIANEAASRYLPKESTLEPFDVDSGSASFRAVTIEGATAAMIRVAHFPNG